MSTVEYLTGGDVATVATQYAHRPSWVEYPLGTEAAQRSTAALVGAVRARIDTLPAGHRPQLLLFGESLGALAAAPTARLADHTVLAGPPGAVADPPPSGATVALNSDDPVGRWSPALAVRPAGPGPWLPIVTFWQVTGSLVGALDVPSGHGHRYGGGLAHAWVAAGAATAPPVRLAAVRAAADAG